jgi:hypothetical protein
VSVFLRRRNNDTDVVSQLLKAVTEWTTQSFRKNGMNEHFSNGMSIQVVSQSSAYFFPGATGICDRVMECLSRLKSAHNGKIIQRLKPNDPRIPGASSSTTSMNSQTMVDNTSLPKPSPINHLTSSSSGQSHQAGLSGGSNSSPASNTLNREHSTMQIANILLDNASNTTAMGR